jgi:8-oxo-dGTP pyrophosphatase MutT (NUDIX family)
VKQSSAAGMIVCKIFPHSGLKLLALERFDGSYDLPKGKREEPETNYECAKRELYEETTISNFKLLSHKTYDCDGIAFFLCVTNDNAKIIKNPQSGKYEHLDCIWLNPDLFESLIDREFIPAYTFFKRSIQQIMI